MTMKLRFNFINRFEIGDTIITSCHYNYKSIVIKTPIKQGYPYVLFFGIGEQKRMYHDFWLFNDDSTILRTLSNISGYCRVLLLEKNELPSNV